jgi:zinc/manganese transport system ATP-binding protein
MGDGMNPLPKPLPRGSEIELDDLTVAYNRMPAVHHLSGRFKPGSLTAIVGPNGAGKSSLLKALIGLLQPSEGRISLGRLPPRKIAYLPQQTEIDRGFPITVSDTVAIGLWRRIGVTGAVTMPMRRRLAEALQIVGLEGLDARPIGMLSVGQLQRVLFARLVLQDAPTVLLDEPFAGVDERTTADLLEVVRQWHAEGRTVLAVLHDLGLVRGHFPDCLLLAREPVAWGPTPLVLTAENLSRALRLSEGWGEAVEERIGGILTSTHWQR